MDHPYFLLNRKEQPNLSSLPIRLRPKVNQFTSSK